MVHVIDYLLDKHDVQSQLFQTQKKNRRRLPQSPNQPGRMSRLTDADLTNIANVVFGRFMQALGRFAADNVPAGAASTPPTNNTATNDTNKRKRDDAADDDALRDTSNVTAVHEDVSDHFVAEFGAGALAINVQAGPVQRTDWIVIFRVTLFLLYANALVAKKGDVVDDNSLFLRPAERTPVVEQKHGELVGDVEPNAIYFRRGKLESLSFRTFRFLFVCWNTKAMRLFACWVARSTRFRTSVGDSIEESRRDFWTSPPINMCTPPRAPAFCNAAVAFFVRRHIRAVKKLIPRPRRTAL